MKIPPSCPCVRLCSSTHDADRPSSRIRASSAPDRYGPQSSRRPSRSIQALGTSFSFMTLAGARRRKTARRVPSSGVRIRGSLQPPGVRRQSMGVRLLLVLSLFPGSGDVQKDIRVAPVLQRRSRFDGPPVLVGVPNLQNGPPVEPPVGPPVPRPLPGPCSQFINPRMIHPVHRDRFSLFTFQEVAVVDDVFGYRVAGPVFLSEMRPNGRGGREVAPVQIGALGSAWRVPAVFERRCIPPDCVVRRLPRAAGPDCQRRRAA